MMLEKGFIFLDPDSRQGYRLKRDILIVRAPPQADDFEAFGGAPEPVNGDIIPNWMRVALRKAGFDNV